MQSTPNSRQRHAIAVHLHRGGADIRHVQAFLGHASLKATRINLRMLPGRLREIYEKAKVNLAGMRRGLTLAPYVHSKRHSWL